MPAEAGKVRFRKDALYCVTCDHHNFSVYFRGGLRVVFSMVARFFLVQYVNQNGDIKNYYKIYQLPQNKSNGHTTTLP
jgi:hypothetical protein